MNEREKKLIMILLGAGFLILNLLGYTAYSTALQKQKMRLKNGADELRLKQIQMEEASTHQDEVTWLAKNMPAEGTHASIRAELVTFTEQSATKHRIQLKKRPTPLRENPDEVGEFRSAVVKVRVNCRDAELYRWLVELQNPKKARSITRLRITPQRDDRTRIDCELDITQWFIPIPDEDEGVTAANP
jgi:hypothetical protein